MSNKIHNRVVEMNFDNRQFESGIKTSVVSLDNLKKSLNLDAQTKSLDGLTNAAKGFSLAGIANGIDQISGKFTALGVMGVTALANIANKAVSVGIEMVKSLTVDPIMTGLNEYETKLNSIQTILANTSGEGTNLDTVTKALDDLNTYSDQTIYNFGQMARNIGTFTAAGVKLDTSVAAIKGIANLAAISGSSSDQASTAMYQLSQALATGSVKLMDWNSVVNAGMGGKVFQESLKETAKAHGIAIDDIIKENGSFRDSLQTGWLSADILTETLSKFTGDLTTEQLKSMGYTEQQSAEILKLGETAKDAATKVKTFHQLMDTLAEAAGSGWAQSWEIVIGNFDEAKEVFTKLSDVIGGFIGKQAEARNELLQGWKDLGGRTELIKALGNVFKFLGDIVKPISEAFRNLFPPTTSKQLYDLTHGFLLFTEKLKVSSSTAESIKSVFSGLFSAIKMGVDIISSVVGGIIKVIGALLTGGDLGSVIGEMFKGLVSAFTGGFSNIIASIKPFISGIIGVFGGISSNITPFVSGILGAFTGVKSGVETTTSGITGTLTSLKDAFKTFWLGLTGNEGGGVVSKFTEDMNYYGIMIRENVLPALENLGNGFKNVVVKIKDAGIAMFNWVKDSSGLDLNVSLGPLTKGLQWFGDTIKSIGEGVSKIAGPFVGLISSIITAITKLFDAFGKTFDENGAYTIFDLLTGGLMIAIMYNINKLISIFKDLTSAVPGLLEGVTNILDGVRGCLQAYQQDIQSKALFRIAGAVALLAAAILVLSLIDPAKLGLATGAITALFAELTTSLSLTSRFTKEAGAAQLAALGASMLLFAGACLILAGALYLIAQLSVGDMVQGLVGLTIVMGLLVGVSKLLSGGKENVNMMKTAFSLILFATAVKIMAGALLLLAAVIKLLGSFDVPTLVKGLGSIGAVLSALYLFMQKTEFEKLTLGSAGGIVLLAAGLYLIAEAIGNLGNMNMEQLIKGIVTIGLIMEGIVLLNKGLGAAAGLEKTSATILALGAALLMISVALKILGTMSLEELIKSVTSFGLIITILVLAMNATTGSVAGAGAMVIMAAAILLMTVAIKALGSLSWETIGKGIAAFAVIMAVFVGVSWAISPLIPIFAGVGAALLLFGLAILAAGAGVWLLATGIATLVAVGIPGIQVFKTGIIEIAKTIPAVAIELAKGIIAFAEVIIKGAPKIIEAIVVLVSGVIDGLIKLLPKIADLIIKLLEEVLRILVTVVPQIAQAALDIILAVLTVLRDNIPKVAAVVSEIVIAFLKAFSDSQLKVINALLETFVNFINGVAEAIRRNSSDMVAAVKNLITAIIDTFKKFNNMFKDVGKMIIEGIINGLGLGPLKDAVFDTGNKVIGWFKDVFDSHSPSKVMEGIGKGLGEGLIVGMKDISNEVRASAFGLGRETKSGLSKGLSGLRTGLETDVDTRPTIRPVVDMTDVKAGIKDAFATHPTLVVAVSADKAAKAVYKTPDANISSRELHGQKIPGGKISETSPPISIVVHNTVRNDQDIRKINQGLRNLLDKSGAKRGVVPAI